MNLIFPAKVVSDYLSLASNVLDSFRDMFTLHLIRTLLPQQYILKPQFPIDTYEVRRGLTFLGQAKHPLHGSLIDD